MKNIDELSLLFVDDEQSVLDGIQRLMRRLQPHWKVKYFSDPVAALMQYKVDAASLDVMVCDVNMPKINGLQLLQAVFEHTPQVIRIALTGQLDFKTVLGANKYADCHICKPVNIDVLCAKIVEVYSLRKNTN